MTASDIKAVPVQQLCLDCLQYPLITTRAVMEMFNFPPPSVCISNRKSNFLRKLSISDNIICRLCAEYQA